MIAEVGKILYTAGGVEWNVVIPGRGWSAKIVAGFRRKLSGGSVVMTEYTGPGAVDCWRGTVRVCGSCACKKEFYDPEEGVWLA